MLTFLAEVKKTKKRLGIFLISSILGLVSCVIVIVVLTMFYQGLLLVYDSSNFPLASPELALIEFIWLVFVLLSFFFMNIIIWYYVSYGLSKKSIIALGSVAKDEKGAGVCYSCGKKSYSMAPENRSNQEIKPSRLFNIEGFFCKKCYQNYSLKSIVTIILIPALYVLNIYLIVLLLMVLGFSHIPNSIGYFLTSFLSFFIFSIIIIIIAFIIAKIKITKIYGKNQ